MARTRNPNRMRNLSPEHVAQLSADYFYQPAEAPHSTPPNGRHELSIHIKANLQEKNYSPTQLAHEQAIADDISARQLAARAVLGLA